jgi:hypothetical protein
MHPRISPASADGGDRCLTKFRERRFQYILHGPAVKLRLPAMPWRAVVLKSECDAFHRAIPETGRSMSRQV